MKDYLHNRLFSQFSGALILKARCDTHIVGMACCSILYPSPLYSGQLHLKELYVSQKERGKGTGKSIMRYITKLAVRHNCRSLSWNVEKLNAGANRLYQSLGGRINDNIMKYSLHGPLLNKLAFDRLAEHDGFLN